MNIELDSIPLNKTGVEEIRNVHNINTSDKRTMVEYEIPGMEGNVFQNLGRSPVKISFDGTLQGKTARSNLEVLRSKFKQGMPLPFNSDISGAADVTKVLIEDLSIEEVAGITERYRYSIVLKEYKEPPPEPTTPPSQDEKAEDWADEEADKAAEGINYLTGKVLDAEGKPKSKVPVLATSSEGEYRGETDEEGVYRIEDLTPGKYKVTVDAEEYEGIEEIVIIGGEETEEEVGEEAEEEVGEEAEEEVGEEAEEEVGEETEEVGEEAEEEKQS